jgi:two-component system, OmpR family, response regulator
MANKKTKIFIVEDDPMHLQMLHDHLEQMSDFAIKDFGTGEECLQHIREKNETPDIVFLDYYLNSVVKDAMDGLDVLVELKKILPQTDVVMLSGQDKIQVAVEVMKYGAFDYIVKGESAFYRAEKAVFNIYRYSKLRKNASMYKTLTICFAIAFTVMIIVFVYMQQKGLISNTPGWM